MRALLTVLTIMLLPLLTAMASEDYLSAPYYNALVEQALREKPENFDFTALRRHYARLDHYDPLAEDSKTRFLQTAAEILYGEDESAHKALFARLSRLLKDHLASYEIVTQAMRLAQKDARFGDPAFYQWLRAGLLQSVKNSGDGYTLGKGYEVITFAEETALIASLGMDIETVQAAQEGLFHYTMYSVRNPQTGQNFTIFVDTTQPMKKLAAQDQ